MYWLVYVPRQIEKEREREAEEERMERGEMNDGVCPDGASQIVRSFGWGSQHEVLPACLPARPSEVAPSRRVQKGGRRRSRRRRTADWREEWVVVVAAATVGLDWTGLDGQSTAESGAGEENRRGDR
jgi:hypothetical protein